MVFDKKLDRVWWMLRIGLGVVPIVAGLDKFLNLLTNWEAYLSPAVPQLLHIPATTFMHVVGVVEIVAGVLVLSRLTRIGAYVVMAWLTCIALSLIAQGRFLDVAVRDLLLSAMAFTLGQLTEIRESAGQTVSRDYRVPEVRRAS